MMKKKRRHREKKTKHKPTPFDQKHFLKVFLCLFILVIVAIFPAVAYADGRTHFLGIGKMCYFILQVLSFPFPYFFSKIHIVYWPLQILGFLLGFIIDLTLYTYLIHKLVLFVRSRSKTSNKK